MSRGDPRDSLNLRIQPRLKARILEYAERAGISINAAAAVLLDKGLHAERRQEATQ